MQKQTFEISGMHCASCSSIISKKLKKLPGIESCDVNFATEKANISFDSKKIDVDIMNNEINKLGYSLSSRHSSMNNSMSGMDHSEHLGHNLSKDEKVKELNLLRRKVKFSLPITFMVFFLMIWDIVKAKLYHSF